MRQEKKNREMMENEIELALKEISETEVGTEERSRAVKDLCVLQDSYSSNMEKRHAMIANYISKGIEIGKNICVVGLTIVELGVIGHLIELEKTDNITSPIGKIIIRSMKWFNWTF